MRLRLQNPSYGVQNSKFIHFETALRKPGKICALLAASEEVMDHLTNVSLLFQILSRDSVTVTVDAVVYYRVSNPTMATNNVEDYGHSTHLLGATTLRYNAMYLNHLLGQTNLRC
jgi:hypothetical protein